MYLNSKHYLSKDVTSRHVQTFKLSCPVINFLCQCGPVNSGKDDLLKCTDSNVRSQDHIKGGKHDTTKGNIHI